MHLKIRVSATKGRKMKGFRRRMKTRGGRGVIRRQRARAMGKPKPRDIKGKTRAGKDKKRAKNKR
jgi:hypothetical protein